jgi:plastocyanin
MQVVSSRKLWLGMLAAGALGLLAMVAFSSHASAHHAKKAGNAEIDMVFDGQHAPKFTGDTTVEAGAKLKIVNKSDPMQIGPHSFSIVNQESIPVTKSDMRHCGHGHRPVCKKIIAELHPTRQGVKHPIIDAGKKGWDTPTTPKHKGDNWFTFDQNSSNSRTVSAEAGTTLYYFCIVHPEMHGKIKVVK